MMPATLCVPLRRSRSCPPPNISGSRFFPALITVIPTPFGPPNLCAESESASTSGVTSRKSIQQAACTASECKIAFGAYFRTTLATSRIGVMVPISLFTAITETTVTGLSSVASSRTRCRSSRSTVPTLFTRTTTPPTCSTQCNTA